MHELAAVVDAIIMELSQLPSIEVSLAGKMPFVGDVSLNLEIKNNGKDRIREGKSFPLINDSL